MELCVEDKVVDSVPVAQCDTEAEALLECEMDSQVVEEAVPPALLEGSSVALGEGVALCVLLAQALALGQLLALREAPSAPGEAEAG